MIRAIEIKTTDGICDAWLAQATGAGPWPGVIFCMDAVGPRANLKSMAERLAASGYVVLLPNLFYREKRAPIVTGVQFPARAEDLPEILKQIMPIVGRFDSAAALRDMDLFSNFLLKQPDVRGEKLGLFGYCMGGALAIRTAEEFPERFAAVASFHAGGLVTPASESPHRLLSKIRAALYVGHADQDPHMTLDQIKEFASAAANLSTPVEVETYKGAHHHFTMADLPAYDAAASEKHWTKLLELFKRSL